MNLADLETLLAVARERGFSRAAEKLRRTQPAVSQAIRRLEQECGESLLDRATQPARLTAAGELVAARASRMVDHRRQLEQELLELRGLQRGKVVVGANESTAFFLLPVVERYRALHPGVKIEVRRSRSRAIPAEVASGDLDLGVVAYDPENRDLSAQLVHRDRLAFVVYPDHPLASRRTPVALPRLGEESFIAHNVDSPYRDFTIAAFRRRRVPLQIAMEMPSLESIKQLVARGLGVAFVPRIAVEREIAAGTLCEVRLRDFRAERPIRLLSRRRGRLGRAAQAFAALACAADPRPSRVA